MFELLAHWLNTPSPTGEETAFAEVLHNWLVAHGYAVQRQNVSPGRFNVLATAGSSSRVLFCTHTDTVLPHIPCRVEEDIIWGRGSCDAKGILYAMIMAGESLRQHGIDDFGYLFVVGEERDSDGAKAAAASGIRSDYVILGEPTGSHLVSHQKGALVFQVTVAGMAGHSGYPESGASAIHRLLQLLQEWLNREWANDPVLGATTLNIGRIRGGQAVNVIAEAAEAEGIFRLTVDPDIMLEYLHSFANQDVTIRVLSASAPQHLYTLPDREAIVVSFGSDAAYLQPIGKVLMVGPGSIHQAHRETEHIYKSEILAAIELYTELVRSLLAG
jgi:acetylornithine deacetylase